MSRFVPSILLVAPIALLWSCVGDEPELSTTPDASVTPEAGDPADSTTPTSDASDGGPDVFDAGPSTYASEVLADSPVGYWRLGEASGIVAKNFATNGALYDVTLVGLAGGDVGRPSLLAKDPDTAIFFSGSTYGEVPIGPFALSTAFTVEAWLRLSESSANWRGIFATVGSTDGFALVVTNEAKLFLACPTKGGFVSTITVPLDNEPHHVVVTFSSTSSISFYVDDQTETVSGPPNIPLTFTSTTAAIGAWTGGSSKMVGVIDELAVYPTVLSPGRIAAHRAAGQP